MTMISSIVLEKSGNLRKNPSKEVLAKLVKDSDNKIWIDIKNPTDNDYDFLVKTFKFHPLTIDDCRQKIELPKIERFKDYIFVVFHHVDYNPNLREIEMMEIYAFLGKNYFVTVHKDDFPLVKKLWEDLILNQSIMERGVDFLMHNIIDKTIDQYLPLLDKWDTEIEGLEDKIIQGETENALEKLVDFRRRVSEMKRSIAPQRHMVYLLSKQDSQVVSEKAAVYFGDILDHIIRAQGILDSQRDLINSAFQAYSSNTTTQLNEVMKTLTLVATIFMPLTLITGIYGMNFQFMPELNSPAGYFIVLTIMLVIGIGMLSYFKKKKWM